MKRIKHIVMGIALMLLVVLGNINVQGDAEKNIEVEVEFGYNNVFRYGDYLPITINVTNKSEAFSGEVMIRYHINHERDAILKQGLTLEKDDQKNVKFIMSNVTEQMQMLRVILLEDGKEVYNKKIKLPFLQGVFKDKTIMGILSDDRDAIAYLQPKGEFVKISLDHQNFPKSTFAIHMFDALVVNNYDLSQLDEGQLDTLKKWVDNGGQLIVGTGAWYTKTLSVLEDFIPMVNITDTSEVSVNALNMLLNKDVAEEMSSDIPLTVVRFEGLEDYKTVVADQENLIYRIHKGNGMIQLFAFDLGMAPMNTYRYKEDLMKNFFVSNNQRNEHYYDSYNYRINQKMDRFLWGIPDIELPTLTTIMVIIGVYVLIINPILYIILKRKKKRHYMWIAIPGLAIIFVAVMYVGGMNTRIKAPVSQVVNTVLFNTSGGSKGSYGTIINTNKSKLTIASIDGLEMMPAITSDGYYYRSDDTNKEYKDFQVAHEKSIGINPTIQFNKTRVFGNYNFEIEPSKNLPETNEVKVDLVYDGGSLKGTVSNHYAYDLTDCLIKFKNVYYVIDQIEAGETIDLTSRTPVKTYDSINSYFWKRQNSFDTLQERQDIDQKENIVDLLLGQSKINESELIIVAWTNHSFYQGFTVSNKQVEKYEKTLICINEPVEYLSGAKIVLDFGELRGMINGNYIKGYYYSQHKSFDIVFKLPTDYVDIKTVKIRGFMQKGDATLRIKNGDVESDVIEDVITLKDEELYKYMTDKGEILLTITLGSDMNDVEIPEIYVEGIGK